MSKNSFARFGTVAVLVAVAATFSVVIGRSAAQQAGARITRAIDNSQRFTIRSSRPPRISAATDLGRVNSSSALHGVTLEFSRSAAQEADLKNLILEQQNPASPLYHKWLTPDEFAARFGLGGSDLAKVEGWLQQQGFKIDNVSRSRTRISFSGTSGQIESAFGTEMHSFRVGQETHFAPSTDISIPAALASVVQHVGHLSDFRPQPRLLVKRPRPNFTSGQTEHNFLTPKDIAVIYDVCNSDINSFFSSNCTASYNGAGQSIAVVGQSAVSLGDIENFQGALGLTPKDPNLVLVPGSGTSAVFSGDESESGLDLEYSSSIASGADIFFVYVGDGTNFSVWDSIQYAVDNRIAPIISISYGICEAAVGSEYAALENNTFPQAVAQGQTVIGPAGDTGSTDCNGVSGLTSAQQNALAVDYPASSAYVTGMGGSEFPDADVCEQNTTTNTYTCPAPSNYWTTVSGTDVISSANGPIPEQVWNDDTTSSPSAGGGGTSTLTARPSWQPAGVNSIPTGNFRLVPDISLTASSNNAPLLFCSSDTGFTGVTGSCANGFRNSSGVLTAAGGTSFDAPIFAGLVALINQKENSTGQGLINTTLYNLASASGAYSPTTGQFRDITSGNNHCPAGSTYCSGTGASTQFAAATGYDQASGLGSIDFNNLLNAWPFCASCSAGTASITTLSAASAMPAVGANDAITITVASGSSSSSATPTGTLTTISVDGTPVASSIALSNGSATFTFTPSTTGSHVITANYSGDSTFAHSTGTVVVGNGSFRLAATNVSIAAGSSGSSTVTITPQNGYTGTIQWNASSSSTTSNICFSIPNATVSGNAPVTASMTIQTNSSACAGAAVVPSKGRSVGRSGVASLNSSPSSRRKSGLFSLAIGLLVAGVFAYRPRRLRAVAGLFVLGAISLAGLGCGSSSKTPAQSFATKGTYTLTVTGTDTVTSTIAASTTLTLTIN